MQDWGAVVLMAKYVLSPWSRPMVRIHTIQIICCALHLCSMKRFHASYVYDHRLASALELLAGVYMAMHVFNEFDVHNSLYSYTM